MSTKELITDHLDLWTSAVTHKSGSGRSASGKNGKIELTGIKKLRDLILELAVRGKLVEQKPSDEPASTLLDRIAEKKNRLVNEGKIKKPKKLPAIAEEEKPFELPKGWEWVRLSDALRVINGRAYKKHEMLQEGTPLLRVGNLFTANEWYYSDLQLEDDKYIDNGDLIYAWSASFGPFIWEGGRAIYHYHIWKLELFDHSSTNKHFLYNYLKAVTEEIKSSGNGIAMIHMTKSKMEELVVPLPPLDEQQRIVEKVDELMALCDHLEQQVGDQLEAHKVLVDTLLDALIRSSDAAESTENWTRVAEHFDTLFNTEASIEKLKQTILQLAVMGRLVPQNPNDEPASMLLDKIAEEKDRLVKEGQIKKPKKLPKITEEERPFDAPPSWAFTRVAELYELQNGYAFKSEWFSQSGIKLLRNINISHGETDWSECVHLPESMASDYQKFSLDSGDLVISLDRPLISTGLKYAIIKKKDLPCLLLQRVARFQPYSDTIATHYLERWINSKMFTNSIDPGRSNGVPHISTRQICKLILPLPPKNEQYRIIEKVDELMALCDKLKTHLSESGKTRSQLAETVVEQAVS
ncbi:hypothetical protein GY26_04800 [Gammaproteobacteria bacterium MFB021]|nr:hypothetical protein GY26_04800 [Gammaproteobacteria bacterium MFB021]